MPVVNYLWDEVEDNVIAEYDDEGNTLARYTTEPYRYGDLISQNRNGEKSYYHFDGQGSTRALTDENENVTDTYTYTAFGEEVAKTGTTENPFRYVGAKGYYFDKETDDYYVRRRVYGPAVGRWTAVDPVGFGDGVNRYIYTRNSAPGYIDASGAAVTSVTFQDQTRTYDDGYRYRYLISADASERIIQRVSFSIKFKCSGLTMCMIRGNYSEFWILPKSGTRAFDYHTFRADYSLQKYCKLCICREDKCKMPSWEFDHYFQIYEGGTTPDLDTFIDAKQDKLNERRVSWMFAYATSHNEMQSAQLYSVCPGSGRRRFYCPSGFDLDSKMRELDETDELFADWDVNLNNKYTVSGGTPKLRIHHHAAGSIDQMNCEAKITEFPEKVDYH